MGDQDFYLDLLFYHLKWRCFVVIDLKAREFTPEAAGKMNFYLSTVDDRFRAPGDQPSIGLILCRSKNRVIAEYALRDLRKSIGVSGYVTKPVDSLPESFKGAVPTVAELEKDWPNRNRAPAEPRWFGLGNPAAQAVLALCDSASLPRSCWRCSVSSRPAPRLSI